MLVAKAEVFHNAPLLRGCHTVRPLIFEAEPGLAGTLVAAMHNAHVGTKAVHGREGRLTKLARAGQAGRCFPRRVSAQAWRDGLDAVPSLTGALENDIDPETGKVVMKSLNDDWHVFFREGVADAPSMLFSLTESWCESAYCRVELVWYLVLKTMGADELLRTEVGGTKTGSQFDVSGVDESFQSTVDSDGQEVRKEDVLLSLIHI